MNKQSTSFWDFSNQFYDKSGVASICLQLQDEFEFDVNLLLFCCWAAHFDREVTEETWARIFSFSKRWQAEVVRPLRKARSWMKSELHQHQQNSQFAALRDRIKMDELAAEQYQQETLEKSFPEIRSLHMKFSETKANAYLSKLVQAGGHQSNKEIDTQLQLLVKAAMEPVQE